MSKRALTFSPRAPLRTWEEVVQEYNKRHPSNPIGSKETVRGIGNGAMDKLRKAITEHHPELWEYQT